MNLNTGGWASPLLRLVARLRSEGVNSTTPVTEINGGTISAANADIALVAKGTGATLAQVPDGTIAGGDKRGQYATDWQKSRHIPGAIASGNYSTIGGGALNTCSGLYSTIAGGFGSAATNTYSFVGGGQSQNASGQNATIVGGFGHTAYSTYSFVGGGASNTAQTNTHAAVCGGSSNTASGQYSFVGGGISNTASGTGTLVTGGSNNTASNNYTTVIGGFQNTASLAYAAVLGGASNTASGNSSCVMGGWYGSTRGIAGYAVIPASLAPIAYTLGATQSAILLLGRETNNATATVLTSETAAASTTNQVILPANAAYYFRGSVIAGVTGAGDTKAWTFEGAIKRGATAASTAIVGSVVLNTIAANAGASAWTVAITADTTNGGIAVTVTGAAATTIRWVAKIETTEMTY